MRLIARFRSHHGLNRIILCGLMFGFVAGHVNQGGAAPLDKNACAKLSQDIQNMKTLEVDKLMEKGPSWAASHLSPGDLSLVRQYIDLDEQMKFRCSAPGSLVHLKHLEDEDDDGGNKMPAEVAEGPGDKSEKSAGQGEGTPSAQSKKTTAKAPKKAQQPAQASTGDVH